MKTRNKTITLSLAAVFSCAFSLLLTHPSFADIDGGLIIPDEIIITKNEGGRFIYDEWNKDTQKNEQKIEVIPKGTKLLSTRTYKDESGEGYYYIDNYNNHWGKISVNDAVYADDYFDMDKFKNSESFGRYEGRQSFYIIDDGACFYAGPSERYGKNEDNYCLPQGIVANSEISDSYWAYFEYDSHSGWVDYGRFGNAHVGLISDSEYTISFITTQEEIILKETPSENSKDAARFSVAQFTTIPTIYYTGFMRNPYWRYIQYGQYSGWYLFDPSKYTEATKYENSYEKNLTKHDTKLYRTVDLNEEIGIIPQNEKINISYSSSPERSDQIRYYVQYGELMGWVDSNQIAFLAKENGGHKTVQLQYEQPLYDSVDGKDTGEKVVPGTYTIMYYTTEYANRNDSSTGTTWYYIGKQIGESWSSEFDEIGWIKALSDEDIKELEEKRKEDAKKAREAALAEYEAKYSGEKRIDNKEENKETEKKENTDTIILLIIGFGILSASIITALILAKKHKKNKEGASGDDGDDSEKSGEKAEENKPNSNEDDAENESKIEEASDENEPNSEENSGENEQNSDEDNAENKPESEKEAEENDPDSERDENETDQDFDDISGEIAENREENGNENSEEEEKSSEENESYFEKELEKIEKETEEKSDEIDQNFAEIEEEIEPNSEKEQDKSSKKFTKKQIEKEKEDE